MFRVRTALSLALSLTLPVVAAEAKTPGKSYCFNGICHTVKTLDETRRLIGVTTTVKASFYDDPKKDSYNPSNLTSSGEYFRAWKAEAQRTVDNAHMRYYIAHIHRLRDEAQPTSSTEELGA